MASSLAPGRLALVQRFINTADLDRDADELDSPAALRDWLAANAADPGPFSKREFDRAIAFRELLRSLAGANNGEPPAASDLAALQSAADSARLRPRFEAGGVRLEPAAAGAAGALGSLVAAVYEAMADGTWVRLKACARSSCRWAFYDTSRNRAATWCSMRVCGNRSKAERFRRRHPAGSP
jgi:predicted RNA-binding Zn ribbon-like protein